MKTEICYVWIEKFRNFENFGFNLSDNVKFQFDNNKSVLLKKTNEIVPNNFYGQNISSVTGIIGKNGTGKSNLLELVCKLLKGGKTSVTSNFLIVIKKDQAYECHYKFNDYINITSDIPTFEYSGYIEDLKVIFQISMMKETRFLIIR